MGRVTPFFKCFKYDRGVDKSGNDYRNEKN
jgi:hypothetical protein